MDKEGPLELSKRWRRTNKNHNSEWQSCSDPCKVKLEFLYQYSYGLKKEDPSWVCLAISISQKREKETWVIEYIYTCMKIFALFPRQLDIEVVEMIESDQELKVVIAIGSFLLIFTVGKWMISSFSAPHLLHLQLCNVTIVP